MKTKLYLFLLAIMVSVSVFADYNNCIDVNDHSIADWEDLPPAFVSACVATDNQLWPAMKKLVVYSDGVYINYYFVFDPAKTPQHRDVDAMDVFINADNSDATGGYFDLFYPGNADILLEGSIWVSGTPVNYSPQVYQWVGPVGGEGFENWENSVTPNVKTESQFVGDSIIEGRIIMGLLPFQFNEDGFEIGFAITQNFEPVGYLPQVNTPDGEHIGRTSMLQVSIDKISHQTFSCNVTSNDLNAGKIVYLGKTTNYGEPDEVTYEAVPNDYCYFVRWSDGVTDAIRTIVLTQDTTIEAIFDYHVSGKCGENYALTWTLNKQLMALNITGSGALAVHYTFGRFIRELTIGNGVTLIGEGAFNNCKDLKHVTLGSTVKVLERRAFNNCASINTITCYSQRPPTVKENALGGLSYSTIVYVPADYWDNYLYHDVWGLYNVRPIGATSTQADEVIVEPSETTVTIIWPTNPNAYTYELVVKDKSGNVVCTLIFNEQGQLLSIAFNAQKRNKAPQQTQTTGFAFTVTGLDSGTRYTTTLTSKASNGSVLNSKTLSFTTTGQPQAINNVRDDIIVSGKKIFLDGQLLIQRGDELFNALGARVK